MGVTGLETAFAALHTGLVLPGVIGLELLVERMTAGGEPFGLELPTLAPGSPANLCLVDLEAEWEVGEAGYESRSDELRLRRPPAHRARAHDDRRRRGGLPRAPLRARRRGMTEAGLPPPRGRHALRRRVRRRRRDRHRRGGLQHGDVGLSGGGDRPELRRADHRLHVPADRELRRGRRRRWSPTASTRAR